MVLLRISLKKEDNYDWVWGQDGHHLLFSENHHLVCSPIKTIGNYSYSLGLPVIKNIINAKIVNQNK